MSLELREDGSTEFEESGLAELREVLIPALGGLSGRRHRADWKPERGFSRKYFDEMLAADKAALAALRAAEGRKRVEQQDALREAALATQDALDAADAREDEVDFAKLRRALDAAVSATNFATSLKRAQDAIAFANAIIAHEQAEEEEEAMLLLLH